MRIKGNESSLIGRRAMIAPPQLSPLVAGNPDKSTPDGIDLDWALFAIRDKHAIDVFDIVCQVVLPIALHRDAVIIGCSTIQQAQTAMIGFGRTCAPRNDFRQIDQ